MVAKKITPIFIIAVLILLSTKIEAKANTLIEVNENFKQQSAPDMKSNLNQTLNQNKKITAKQFSFDTLISNEKIDLSQYKNNVLLVVNTASKCGFTGQYEGLEALYQRYKNKGLVVIGVPSSDFGNQELASEKEIASFCELNFGVSFPLTAKYKVRGEGAHPFYRWAKDQLGFASAPKWNFHKYLINQKGELIDYFYSTTQPQSNRVIKAIEKALSNPS